MTTPRIIAAAEHGISAKAINTNAAATVRRLQQHGFEAYIVGGGVRDLILGHEPKDFDVATSATPDEVRNLFRNSRLIGRRFRLAHVYFGREVIEVATFRGHASRDGQDQHLVNGRIIRDNVWGDLAEDAERRDFTVNALFLDPVKLEVRDFVGGYDDLKAGVIRLIGDPETRYKEDPVRLIRAARFEAKLGLNIEPETAEPIKKLGVLLQDIPPARLFEEVNKLFLSGHAVQSLHSMQRYGLLSRLFPQLREQGQLIAETPMLLSALANTDERIRVGKPVTPAFLFAVLLWPAVEDQAVELIGRGYSPNDALSLAGDQVVSAQVRATAIPRRFSAVSRQIWLVQPRFEKFTGRKADHLLADRVFRAAYDFLLLRAEEDPSLAPQVDFWTDIQTKSHEERQAIFYAQGGKRKRRRRKSPKKRSAGQGGERR